MPRPRTALLPLTLLLFLAATNTLRGAEHQAEPRRSIASPAVASATDRMQSWPAVAAAQGRVLVTWTQANTDGTESAATVALFNEAGVLIRQTLTVANSVALAIASSGSSSLAVYGSEGTIYARRLTIDGAPVDREAIPLGAGYAMPDPPSPALSVAWTGESWAIVWAAAGQAWFATVTREGMASTPVEIPTGTAPSAGTSRSIMAVALAFDGTRALFVWNEQWLTCSLRCSISAGGTFALRLSPDGEVLDSEPVVVRPGHQADIWWPFDGAGTWRRLGLATSGSEFALLDGTTVSILDGSGSAPVVVGLRDLLQWRSLGDLTWSGADYVVTLRYEVAREHVGAWHLDRSGNPIGTPRIFEPRPSEHPSQPRMASLSPATSIVALQEGDAGGQRVSVVPEAALREMPPPPARPLAVTVSPNPIAWESGRFEVTWNLPADATVELYRVHDRCDDIYFLVTPTAGRAAVSCIDATVASLNAAGESAAVAAQRPIRRRSVR